MTSFSPTTSVADLVTERPARARIFEQLGIDYCCGGDQSLEEACRTQDLDPDTVRRMLDAVEQAPPAADARDWSTAPLGTLIDHIVDTHHAYLRRELPRLETLLTRVLQAHGDDVEWLAPTVEVFTDLQTDLAAHMRSEEQRVFPSIRALETHSNDALNADGIDDMIGEHDEAGAALDRLRTLTNDYTPPRDACPTFRAALDGLKDLERDMHRHVHKENNILFPRARALA
jgi:regulator of cell morphogenesis and NO signaling